MNEENVSLAPSFRYFDFVLIIFQGRYYQSNITAGANTRSEENLQQRDEKVEGYKYNPGFERGMMLAQQYSSCSDPLNCSLRECVMTIPQRLFRNTHYGTAIQAFTWLAPIVSLQIHDKARR